MSTKYLFKAGLFILSAFFLWATEACVNREYDLTNVNKEITVGGDSLSIPLGSTEQLTFKDLMSELDEDALKTISGGIYAFQMNGSATLDDRLAEFNSILNIPDVSVSHNIPIEIGTLDAEDLSFLEQNFRHVFDLGEMDMSADIEIPAINRHFTEKTGIWKYAQEISNTHIALEQEKAVTDALYAIPDIGNIPGSADDDTEISLDMITPEASFDTIEKKIHVSASHTRDLSNLSDITFTDDSRICITMSMKNSFLTRGSIVPDITVNLSELVSLKDVSGALSLSGAENTLSESNNYTVSRTFYLDKANISPEEWDSDGNLDIDKSLFINGKVTLSGNPATTVGTIRNYLGDMYLEFTFEFLDVAVKSAQFDLAPIRVEKQTSVELSFDDITLPEQILNVGTVTFTPSSTINFNISTDNLDIAGLDKNMEKLTLIFPDEIKVAGATDGRMTFSGMSLASDINLPINIESIDLPAPVDGVISYCTSIDIDAVATADGHISSADLPASEAEDGAVCIDVTSNLQVEDYSVLCDDIVQELDAEPEIFRFDLPDNIADAGTMTIIPEKTGNPSLEMKISLPESASGITAGNSGIVIGFPEFLKFTSVDPAYNFDEAANTIRISGEIPEKISLPIDRLVITPEKDETAGKYFTEGEISISGNMKLASREITKTEIDDLTSSGTAVEVTVPAMTAKQVILDNFSVDLKEETDVTLIAAKDIPEELTSIESATAKDVYAELNIRINNLPDFGAGNDIHVQCVVTLPPEIVLDETDPRIVNGALTIDGILENGKLPIEPVKISGFSSMDFSSKEDITGHISINGTVYADKPSINLDELSSADLSADVSVSIKSICFEKIEGRIDYTLEPVEKIIALDGIPDFMKDENTVLDLENPYLILKINSNLGTHCSGTFTITPVCGGVDNAENAISFDVVLPYSENSKQQVESVYWISKERGSCPSDYNFVEADLGRLIRKMPDELKLSLNAVTDPAQNSIVEPDAAYNLSAEYEITAPLSFGEDLQISISDKVENLPDIVGRILETGKLKIIGSVTSSLPVLLELELQMLDADDNVIPMEKPATQMISACASDGSTVTSPLNLEIYPLHGSDAASVKAFNLIFTAKSGNTAGIAVTEDAYVQADIQLMVPGGITMNLEDLVSGSEE